LPLLPVTVKTTDWLDKGLPDEFVSETTNGLGRAVPMLAVWLFPETSDSELVMTVVPIPAAGGCEANALVMVLVTVVPLPARSTPFACMVFAPTANGTFAAEYVRLATTAGIPFTVTCTSPLLTVPTTTSFAVPLTVRLDAVVVTPVNGESTVMCGGVVSSVNWTLAVVALPLEFVATAVKVFKPSTNGIVAWNCPPVSGALTPLIVTLALGSPTKPTTFTGLVLV
jgi:hypothetical protein